MRIYGLFENAVLDIFFGAPGKMLAKDTSIPMQPYLLALRESLKL